MAKVKWALKTDIGRTRKANQDSLAVLDQEEMAGRAGALFVLADGMGGRAGGEVASRIAVDTAAESVRQRLSAQAGEPTRDGLCEVVHAALISANAAVWQKGREDPGLKGMGTTCIMALVRDNMVAVGNAGDSRVYLLRDEKLVPVTHDHVLLHSAAPGSADPSEPSKSRFHNTITRAIGFGAVVEPDVTFLQLQDQDILLLCSDGLTNMVKDDEIAHLLMRDGDPQQACDRLVAAANHNGGGDNISVIVMHHGDVRMSKPPTAAQEPVQVASRAPAEIDRRSAPSGNMQVWSVLGIIVVAILACVAYFILRRHS